MTYMGTDPPTQAVDMQHSAELDYAALDAEYRQLSTRIQVLGAPAPVPPLGHQLTISAQVQFGNHAAAVLSQRPTFAACMWVHVCGHRKRRWLHLCSHKLLWIARAA